MDGIQAISSKNPLAAPNTGLAANDDDSAAVAFGALLDLVGIRVKGDTGLTLDAKLLRNTDPIGERAGDPRDTNRDAAKVRDDKDDVRPAKAKESKSSDDDKTDSKSDQSKATDDDAAQTDAATDASQAAQDRATTQVVAAVSVEIPLVTTEVLAPILIAQQVAAPVEAAITQTSAPEIISAAIDSAASSGDAPKVATGIDTTVGQRAAIVEAPAALSKSDLVTDAGLKRAIDSAAAPDQSTSTETPAQTAQIASSDDSNVKSKGITQTNLMTQRSAAAQQQSQEISRAVGNDSKAQVRVTVTNQASQQTTTATSIYDIYSGYSGGQMSTANGQVGIADAGNALSQNTKAPADLTPAQVASIASPALAPQPQTQAPQQGASSSVVRADAAVPTSALAGSTGGQSSGNLADSSFGGAGTNAGSSAPATAAIGTPAASTERPLATAQQVIDQIKVNITRAAKAGMDRVTIRLKPQELGRIDIQLEMSEDHKVRVTVTADNKDTLSLLQTDSRTLERALNDAGLRTDTSNLHFSLRSESDTQTAGDDKSGGKSAAGQEGSATDDAEETAMTYDYTEAARARGGIDTFA